MTLDSITYPSISLPSWLRMKFLWNQVILFATLADNDEISSMVALEREFKELITRENATISKICFSYSGSVAEFDDLRQDVLINIWRGMKSFRGESSQRTWVYRITVNSCLTTIRRHSRYQHEDLDSLYGLIESDNSDKEDIEQLHQAIGRLGAQDKAIIMMWLDELTYDEIATAMGLARNTIATKIRRIKDKLTNEYKKEGDL